MVVAQADAHQPARLRQAEPRDRLHRVEMAGGGEDVAVVVAALPEVLFFVEVSSDESVSHSEREGSSALL